MKNGMEKRQKRLTLKQYLHSNSLRKKANSRCSSKEYSHQKSVHPNSHASPGQSSSVKKPAQMTKEQLEEEIKVTLAELIHKDQELVRIMKLIDQLISAYRDELNRQLKDNEVMFTLLRQKGSKVKEHNFSQRSRESRVMIDEHHFFTTPFEDTSFQSMKSGHLATPRRQNTRDRLDSESLVDIPNINILLQTRHKDDICSQADQQTKQTAFPKKDHLKVTNTQGSSEVYAFQSFGNDLRKRKSSINSNVSHFANRDHYGNIDDAASEVRVSLRTSLWNNLDPRMSRNAFDQDQLSFKH